MRVQTLRPPTSEFVNTSTCCEPIEIALLPILITLIPVCLGPKGYMAIPCYVTKEHMKRRGPSYHTDIAGRWKIWVVPL